MFPNQGSLVRGQSIVEPVEPFRGPYRVQRIPMSPLDMAAAARMMGRGTRGVLGIPTLPWRQDNLARNSLQIAQAAPLLYNPIGYGQRY